MKDIIIGILWKQLDDHREPGSKNGVNGPVKNIK